MLGGKCMDARVVPPAVYSLPPQRCVCMWVGGGGGGVSKSA